MGFRHYYREACVCSLEEAIQAQSAGVDRIELCESIELDGLTPSIDLLSEVSEKISIPIRIMIRPRAGNFVYSEEEFNSMKSDIEKMKSLRIEGFVLGCLDQHKKIDVRQLSIFNTLIDPLKITFHKAIDASDDLINAVRTIKQFDAVDYILTSGGEKTAYEGLMMLKKMVQVAGKYPKILVAGKVVPEIIPELALGTGATSFHGRRIY